MRLFFDTETSGLWRDDLPFDHPSQPSIVQLAVHLYDVKWQRTGHFVSLIKPDGWSIEPEAEAHHGISEARCSRFGIPLPAALLVLKGFASTARRLVGHHVEFDRKVIKSSLQRLGADGLWWQKKGPDFFCTMEASTPVLQLPGDYGFKFPSLEEAHRFFYPEMDYSTQHDADQDSEATMRVFRALDDTGRVPER